MNAPLGLFVYKRPDHSARTIAALKACDDFAATPVTVFSDGPKSAGDIAAVNAVRALVAAELPGATLVAAPANKGLAASIIAGVTRLVGEHGRVIVVEDDLLVAPDFLTFMNAALDRYADDDRVVQVTGFLPILRHRLETAVFMPHTSSWTWGTWARAWRLFEADPVDCERLSRSPALRHRFNRNGTYDYARALTRQRRGETDSWAIRWYWSVFKAGGLTVYPPQSLVTNIGFDGSGTHGARGVATATGSQVPPSPAGPFVWPEVVEVDSEVEATINRAYRATVRNPVALAKSALRMVAGMIR